MWKAIFTVNKIQAILWEEGTIVSKTSLSLLIKKFSATGSVEDNRTAQGSRKLTHEMIHFIDDAMARENELSAKKLHNLLKAKFPSTDVSESTIKRTRRELGWVAKRTRYCALISEKNKEVWATWCNQQVRS